MRFIGVWLVKVICCVLILLYALVYSVIHAVLATIISIGYLLSKDEALANYLKNDLMNDWKTLLKNVFETIRTVIEIEA